MKVIQLVAENFKRLQAVEITPEGNVVTIGGRNGSGKSSVLDAIYVALVGRSAAPPKPVRNGEESCVIKLDLGELKVTRRFAVKEGAPFTDSLKVENADGLRYGKPQEVLDALLGEIGFDPLEFANMKPKEQAETLLQMVPLSVDLDEIAELDTSDYQKRRDLNRDAAGLQAQIAAIPKEEVPPDLPDRQALVDQLGRAAEHNGAIERERFARQQTRRNIDGLIESRDSKRARADQLRAEAAALDDEANQINTDITAAEEELGKLKPLAEPIDAAAIQQQLTQAEALLARAERQSRRADLEVRHAKLTEESQALTDAMASRAKARNDALAAAKMPIEGLAFALDEKGHPVVQFGGVPFEQASSAEQIRASTKIAMEANPQLRVLRIKDGSLLDDDTMKLLAEMAAEDDFQLWIERVGTGGVGIVMENGEVATEKPTAKKAKGKTGDEALL